MAKNDKIKIFIDKIYSSQPKKNYKTNKIIYNYIVETWSIDLADLIGYKISNNKGYRYTFVIFDKFSKYTWCTPWKKMVKQ